MDMGLTDQIGFSLVFHTTILLREFSTRVWVSTKVQACLPVTTAKEGLQRTQNLRAQAKHASSRDDKSAELDE